MCEDYGKYLERLKIEGYIDEKGFPIKCANCNGTSIDMTNCQSEIGFIVSCDYVCGNCNHIIASYDYGGITY